MSAFSRATTRSSGVRSRPVTRAPRRAAVTDTTPVPHATSRTRWAEEMRLPVGSGFLRVQLESDAIVRVIFSAARMPRLDDLVVVGTDGGTRLAALNPFGTGKSPAPATHSAPKWRLDTSNSTATLKT